MTAEMKHYEADLMITFQVRAVSDDAVRLLVERMAEKFLSFSASGGDGGINVAFCRFIETREVTAPPENKIQQNDERLQEQMAAFRLLQQYMTRM